MRSRHVLHRDAAPANATAQGSVCDASERPVGSPVTLAGRVLVTVCATDVKDVPPPPRPTSVALRRRAGRDRLLGTILLASAVVLLALLPLALARGELAVALALGGAILFAAIAAALLRGASLMLRVVREGEPIAVVARLEMVPGSFEIVFTEGSGTPYDELAALTPRRGATSWYLAYAYRGERYETMVELAHGERPAPVRLDGKLVVAALVLPSRPGSPALVTESSFATTPGTTAKSSSAVEMRGDPAEP
jgi:hypothetical protein